MKPRMTNKRARRKGSSAPKRVTRAKRRKQNRAARKSDLVIIRSSGRKEKFDSRRMAQTISRSGTPFMMARDIAKKVSRHLAASKKSNKRQRPVEGNRVRKMVTRELLKRNRPDIASSYVGQRPYNAHQGRIPMDDENEPVLNNVAANRSKLLYDGTSYLAKSTKSASTG